MHGGGSKPPFTLPPCTLHHAYRYKLASASAYWPLSSHERTRFTARLNSSFNCIRKQPRMPSVMPTAAARAAFVLVVIALLLPRASMATTNSADVTSETVREMFEHAYVASFYTRLAARTLHASLQLQVLLLPEARVSNGRAQADQLQRTRYARCAIAPTRYCSASHDPPQAPTPSHCSMLSTRSWCNCPPPPPRLLPFFPLSVDSPPLLSPSPPSPVAGAG